MKLFSTTAIVLAASAQLCCADLFAGFFGKWTTDGLSGGNKVTTTFKRYQSKGMVSNFTVITPGLANGTGTTRYYDNGKVSGDFKRGGTVVTRLQGTWQVSGKTLTENITITGGPGMSVTQVSKVKLVNPNKVTTKVKQDGTALPDGSLTRKK